MTLAVPSRRARTADEEHVIRVQQRRRSNASGLHGLRPRGGRRGIERLAITESLTSWLGDDDENA